MIEGRILHNAVKDVDTRTRLGSVPGCALQSSSPPSNSSARHSEFGKDSFLSEQPHPSLGCRDVQPNLAISGWRVMTLTRSLSASRSFLHSNCVIPIVDASHTQVTPTSFLYTTHRSTSRILHPYSWPGRTNRQCSNHPVSFISFLCSVPH
ncbi:uncharacterized protein EI90DRAFT_277538 [Cantharellus anzutake]|uniref:uncharacterized protein n=1 Tax=Cantharellus anzutake TaxID=1750568 RepID=UPI001904577C|nr:uncharacterized protein EI90DRAFT_277538 [Cantharellus anzutake]KAF8335933.1 hypothetical protein EI90DRAFT_277538 [Cantharellus anzutake]